MTKTPLNSIAIIGCGWLGTPLAHSLQPLAKKVLVSSRSQQKLAQLTQAKLTALQLELPLATLDNIAPSVSSLFQCQQLVIMLTPGIRQGRVDYPQIIEQIVQLANQGQVKQLILVSSTAVFPETEQEFNEFSPINIETDKQRLLRQAEFNVQQFQGKSTILRLSGLVGETRHPKTFFDKGRKLANAKAPINLIHQLDAVALIQQLLLNHHQQQHFAVVHGVTPYFCQKTEFYQYANAANTMTKPKSYHDDEQPKLYGKRISSSIVGKQLGFNWHYPNLLDWLAGV